MSKFFQVINPCIKNELLKYILFRKNNGGGEGVKYYYVPEVGSFK